jgi:hypothetical protein
VGIEEAPLLGFWVEDESWRLDLDSTVLIRSGGKSVRVVDLRMDDPD